MLLPVGVLFGPALASDSSFAMRDAGHFYYPLFQWTSGEWGAGRAPLWNQLDAGGTPVVADASSSVFYPGKLVFALPVSFALRFKLYAVAHVLLAAFGGYRLARRCGGSTQAAVLAAVGYSCGGSVAFQYCNVVFLVGAAWLPWAWLALLAWMQSFDWRWLAGLAVALALMILGGDPQMAVHALLGGLLYVLLLGRDREHRRDDPAAPGELARLAWRTLVAGLAGLGGAALLAFLLAAVQVLPAREAAEDSTRAAYATPRNVYEAVAVAREPSSPADKRKEPVSGRIVRGIFTSPAANTHHEDVYDFSIGPWRFAELFWPNVFGRMFPIHRRWLNELPAEGRIWTPTLYLGLLTSVLGLWQLRFRSVNRRQAWLSWTFVLFALGSLGWYGIGWLVREVYASVLGGDSNQIGIGHPVGGVYWLLVTFVPSYVQFRYPAKLLVVASLALSLLAAKGWDEALEKEPKSLTLGLKLLVGASVLGLIGSWLMGGWFMARAWQADPAFGPFDAAGALFDLRLALAQTIVVAAVSLWFFRDAGRRSSQVWRTALLVLLLLELSLANRCFVATAPAATWRRPSDVAASFNRLDSGEATKAYRVRASNWWPSEFATASSPERMRQITAWEHDTLFPKHNLLAGQALADSSSSLRPADRDWFWKVARRMRGRGSLVPHQTALQLTGTQWVVAPPGFRPAANESWQEVQLAGQWSADVRLWRVPAPLPGAWVVNYALVLSPLPQGADPRLVEERTRHVLMEAGQPRDFRRTAVVETDQPVIDLVQLAVEEEERPDCRVDHISPQRLVMHAELTRPGLLVINQPYARGWVARRVTDRGEQEVPVLRTNRILQGIALPAGKHTIEISYEPSSLRVGAVLSGVCWLAVLVAVGAGYFRSRG